MDVSVTTNRQKSAEAIVIVEENDEGQNLYDREINQNVRPCRTKQKTDRTPAVRTEDVTEEMATGA